MAVVMEEDVFMSDMILAAKEFAPIWEGALLHKNKVISNVRALGRSRLQKQMPVELNIDKKIKASLFQDRVVNKVLTTALIQDHSVKEGDSLVQLAVVQPHPIESSVFTIFCGFLRSNNVVAVCGLKDGGYFFLTPPHLILNDNTPAGSSLLAVFYWDCSLNLSGGQALSSSTNTTPRDLCPVPQKKNDDNFKKTGKRLSDPDKLEPESKKIKIEHTEHSNKTDIALPSTDTKPGKAESSVSLNKKRSSLEQCQKMPPPRTTKIIAVKKNVSGKELKNDATKSNVKTSHLSSRNSPVSNSFNKKLNTSPIDHRSKCRLSLTLPAKSKDYISSKERRKSDYQNRKSRAIHSDTRVNNKPVNTSKKYNETPSSLKKHSERSDKRTAVSSDQKTENPSQMEKEKSYSNKSRLRGPTRGGKVDENRSHDKNNTKVSASQEQKKTDRKDGIGKTERFRKDGKEDKSNHDKYKKNRLEDESKKKKLKEQKEVVNKGSKQNENKENRTKCTSRTKQEQLSKERKSDKITSEQLKKVRKNRTKEDMKEKVKSELNSTINTTKFKISNDDHTVNPPSKSKQCKGLEETVSGIEKSEKSDTTSQSLLPISYGITECRSKNNTELDENIADLQVSASPDALLTSQDWINISNVVLCTNESSTDNTKSSLETTGITDNERMERIAENINYLLEKNTNEKEVKYDEHINYLLEKNTNEKEVLYDHDVSQSDKSSSATEPTLTDEERMNRIATDIENRSEKVSCESFSMSPIITDDERVERIAANVGYQLEQTKCDSGVDSGFSDTQSLQDWEKPHTAVNVPSLSVDSVKDHVSTEMLMDILKKAQDKSEHLATMPPEVDSTDSSSDGTKSPVIVIDYKHGKADTNCDEDYLLDDMKMGASKLHPACSENATDIGVGLSPEVPFNDGTDNTCQDSNIYMSNRRLRNNYCDEQEQIVAYTTRRPKRNDEKKKNVYDDRCSSDVLYTKEYVPTEIAKHYRKRRCSGIIHSGSDSAAEIPLQFISKTFVVPQLQVSDKNVDLSAEQLKRGPEGERRWVKVTDNPLDIPLLHTYKDKFSSQGYLLDNVNDHMVPEEYPGVLQKAKKENSNEHFGLDGLAKKHDFPTSSFSGRGDIDMRNIDKHYHANNRTDSSDSKTVLSPRYPLQDVDYYNDEITNQKENPEKLRKTKKENRSDYFGLFGLAGKDDFLTCTGNISRRHDIDMRCHEQNSAVSSDSRISLTNDKENMSGLMRRSEYFGVTNFTKEPSSIKVVENISGVKSTGKSINSLARNILHARIVEDMDDNYPETEQDNVFDIMQLSKDFDKKQSHDIHSKSEFTHGQKWNKSHRSDMQKSNEVLPPNDKDIVIPPKCAAGRFIPQMWDVMRRILNANNKIDYFQKTISDGVKRTTAMLKDHANSWSKKRRQFADQFKILNTAFASLQSIAKAAHFLSQQENTKVKCNLDTIAKDLKKTDQILWRMVSYSHTEGDVVLKARDRCSMVIAAIKAKAKQIERSLDYPSETDSCHTAVDNKATVASSSGSSLFSFGKGEFSCCVDREDRPFESIAVIMSKVWKKKMEIEKIIAEQEMDEKILMDANMDSDSDGVMGEQQCSKPKKRLVLDTTFTGGCVDEAVKSQDPAPRLTYNQYTDRYENDGSRSGSRSVDTPSQACTQHISSLKSPLRSSTCANRSVLDLHLSITQTKDNMFSHALTKNVEDNTQSIIASEKNTSPEQDKQSVSLVLMPDKGLSEVKQERNHQGILKNNSANHIKALNTTCKPVFPPHIKGDENMNLRGKPDKVLPIADTARQNGGGRSIYTSSQVCTQGSSSMNTASATQEISRKIYHLKKSPLRGSLLQRSTCANRSVLDLPLPISQTKQDITRNVEENTQSIIASEKITSHHQDKQSMPLVLMPEKGQAEGKREPNQQGLLKENSANHIKALNTTCKPVFPPHVKGDENNNLIGKPEKVLPIEDSARQNGGGRSIDTSSQASTQGNSSENTASATREISRKIYHLKKSTLRGSLLQRSTCANRSVLDLPLPISQTKENVFSQDITKNVEENTQSIIASEKNASPEQDKQSVPSVLMPEVEQERNNQGLPKEISVNYIKAHNTTCKSVFPPHVKGDENMNLKGKTEKVLSISDNARQNCGGKSIDTSSQVCAQYISSCKSSGNVQQAMLIEKGNSSINTSVKTHKISCEIYNLKKSPLRSSSPRSYTCPNRSVLDIPLTAITPKENVLSHDLTKNVNENTKSIIASEKNTSHQQDKQSMPLVLELEERQSEVKPERNQQGILKENSVNQIKAHITTCKPVFPPFVKDNEKIYLKGEPEKVLPIADNRRPNVRRDVLGDAITREAALAKLVSLPSKPIVTRADDLLPVNILSAGVSSSTSLPEMIAGIVNIPRPVLRFHVKNKRKENVCMKSVFGDDSPSETETDDDKSPDNHMYEANRPMSPVSKVATINAALSSGEHHADKIAAKTFSTNLNVNQQCSNKTKGEGFNKTQITMVNSLLQANTISQGKNSIMEVTNIEMNRLATDEFMRTESNLFETTLKNTRAESVDNNEPSKTQILTTTSVDPGGSESLKENIPGSSGMVDSNLKTVGKGNSKVKNSQEHMTKVRGICGNLCMRLQKSSSPGQWMVKTCNVMDDDKYDPANNSRDMKFDKQQTDGRSGRIIKCGCGDDPEYPKMNDTVEPLVKKSVVLKSSTRDVDNCVKTNHTSISSNYTNATYTSIIPGRHNNFPDGELLQNQGVPSANVSTNCDRNQHVNTARFSDRNHPSLLIDNMLNKNETSFDKTRLSPTSPNVPAIVIEPLGMEEEEEMRRTYEQLYMANKQTPLHDNACIRRSPIQDTPIFESYFTTDYLINSKLVADSQASTETQVSLPATSPPSTEYKTLGTHGHPTHCNDGVLAKFVTSPFDLSREKNTLSSSSIFSDLVMQPINNDHQYSSKDRQTTVSSTAAVATDTVQTQMTSDGSNSSSLCPSSGTPLLNVIASDHQYSLNHDDNVARMTPMVTVQPPAWTGSYPATAFAFVNPPPTYGNYIYNHHTGQWQPMGIYQGYYGVHS